MQSTQRNWHIPNLSGKCNQSSQELTSNVGKENKPLQDTLSMLSSAFRTPKKYKRRTEINWTGTLAYIFFFCAFGFYMWIRITKTLDLGLYVGAQAVIIATAMKIDTLLTMQQCSSGRLQHCTRLKTCKQQTRQSSILCAHMPAGYGVFVLIVEIIGASTVMLYGVNLLWNPVIEKFEEDPMLPGRPKV